METRIKALLAVQIIALPLATAWASNNWGPHPATAVFFSLIFSEAGLLGLWAAFGKSRPWVRLSCVGLWLSCLSITIPIAERGRGWLHDFKDLVLPGVVVTLPALAVFFVLRILERSRGLRFVRSPPLQASSEGVQFSIKHLLAVTAIVAAIMTIHNGLQNFGYGRQLWIDMAVVVVAVVPSVLLVELATFWAALGLSRPLPRLMVVVPSGILVGIVPPFLISRGSDWQEYGLWSGITGLQVLLTAATLLVFRSCGWRLCRTTGGEKQLAIAAEVPIEEAELASEDG